LGDINRVLEKKKKKKKTPAKKTLYCSTFAQRFFSFLFFFLLVAKFRQNAKNKEFKGIILVQYSHFFFSEIATF
jgi:hypothetical protein